MAKVILEHDREFDFYEFCQYMANIYVFLATRPGYHLEKYPHMEGMQTRWSLYERMRNWEDTYKAKIGPTLYYSNMNKSWCGIDPSPDMPFKFVDEKIKYKMKDIPTFYQVIDGEIK